MVTLETALAEIAEKMPKLSLLEQEPMNKHCSFRVGGPVRAFAQPRDIWELTRLCSILHENDVLPLTLGKCTNVLFPDEENDIIVISTENLQKLKLGEKENTIYAEAGVSLARLAQFAQENGLSGLEFASGIPGSVGGGVLMNAGAYDGEMKDIVDSVVSYYLTEQALCETPNKDCDFAYRHSGFEKVSCIILGAVFKLTPADPADISAKMSELNERRRRSQPLDMPSAGSAFKRPEKGYAAALIDECGLKGFTVGGAQISTKHAGFAVNAGNASYDDVVELLDRVRRTVYEKKGVTLYPEIKIYPRGMQLIDTWRIQRTSIMNQMADTARAKVDEAAAREAEKGSAE